MDNPLNLKVTNNTPQLPEQYRLPAIKVRYMLECEAQNAASLLFKETTTGATFNCSKARGAARKDAHPAYQSWSRFQRMVGLNSHACVFKAVYPAYSSYGPAFDGDPACGC